jgi:hypothetical protein
MLAFLLERFNGGSNIVLLAVNLNAFFDYLMIEKSGFPSTIAGYKKGSAAIPGFCSC